MAGNPRVEQVVEQVRSLNEQIVSRARQGGEESLRAYKELLENVAEAEEAAGNRTAEWVQAFARAVDRVSTISSERGRAVKLALAEGRLTLTVNNPDSGSAEEEMPVEYAHDPIDIGFNARYLLDVASQVKSDHISFLLADAGSPTIVKDPGDEHALYVLMPMRV